MLFFNLFVIACTMCKGGSVVKNPPAICRRLSGSIPGSGRYPGEGNGNPLQLQPTTVFLPGKSHGQRSLAGYKSMGLQRVRYNLVSQQQQQSTVC